jgi:hypothetical protein
VSAEHPFVAAVREELDRLAYYDTHVTQDELDVFLLGGTVPAWPIPRADPDCQWCWGAGVVCSCHGISRLSCPLTPVERCECLPKPGRPKRVIGREVGAS